MKKIFLLPLILVLMLVLSMSCKKNISNENLNDNNQNKGRFSLLIVAKDFSKLQVTTKPEDVLSLIITIDQLSVHRIGTDAGWKTIDITECTFDLIEMETEALEVLISSAEISAGNYNIIRFYIDKAQVTTESGEYEAEIPSNKIQINIPFIVNEDGSTEITLNMEPKASLTITGKKDDPKYILHPVIHVEEVEED